VLAYSTMSQIGYMMFALGVSGYGGENGLGFTASMFHLFTHAFFKSLLFLGAGAVIHLVHSNEMKDLGGLRNRMPVTHIAFLIACLAIAGIPPFAGFFSKEEILLAAFNANKAVYGIALFTAALTAFYMFRLYFSIFWKTSPPAPLLQSRRGESPEHHHGEGTTTMKLPLVILAICAVGAGFVPFASFVTSDGAALATHMNIAFSVAPVALAVLAILLAASFYKTENEKPAKMAAALGGFYIAAKRKFYIDEVYLFVTKKILFNLVGRPAAWIDRHVIDGMMNGLAYVTTSTSNLVKGVQSGRVQNYALLFFAGVAMLVVLYVYLWQ
jgi:NADH-quinone oxidoreductase subunit L